MPEPSTPPEEEKKESAPPKLKSDDLHPVERFFEAALWNSRFIALLAVVFGLIAAISLFITGSVDIVQAIFHAVEGNDSSHLVGDLIGAIDYYLIGVVLLIFSFGIYELFISQLEIGRENDEVKILEITNLDDLKNRIIKVVIMVLIVSFFKKMLQFDFKTAHDMAYFSGSILAICLGVYFMHKADQHALNQQIAQNNKDKGS